MDGQESEEFSTPCILNESLSFSFYTTRAEEWAQVLDRSSKRKSLRVNLRLSPRALLTTAVQAWNYMCGDYKKVIYESEDEMHGGKTR